MMYFPNSMICSRLLAWLVTFMLLLHSGAAIAQPSQRSYGEQLADRLFEMGAISYYFNDEVRSIAEKYASGTRFEGSINVNLPRKKDRLTILIFHYSSELPLFLQNNCNSFSMDDLILCDHTLLDSIPSTPPLVFNQGDGIELPLMMQWIIGHEMAHVLFHDIAQGMVGNKLGDVIDISQSIEIRADVFASRGIANTKSAWLQLGSQLADAIFWEERKYKALKKSSSGSKNSAQPEIQEAEDTYTFDVVPGAHPPLLVRLSNFLDELKRINTSYPTNSALSPRLKVIINYLESADESEKNQELFYDGTYVGSDFEKIKIKDILTQEALALILNSDAESADGILKKICSPITDQSKTAYLVYITCLLSGTPKHPPATLPPNCRKLSPQLAGPCIGATIVIANACASTEKSTKDLKDLCRKNPGFGEKYRQYADASVSYAIDPRLLAWMLPAEYRLVSNMNVSAPEKIRKWVENAAASTANSGYFIPSLNLLNEYFPNLSDPAEKIKILTMKHQIEVARGNLRSAINTGIEIAKLLSVNFPEQNLELGDLFYQLGRLSRVSQTPVLAQNDAAGFAMRYASDDEQKASTRSIEASADYLIKSARIYEREMLKQKGVNKKSYEMSLIKHLNSLGGALFSYNLSVIPNKKALELSRLLEQELKTISPIPLAGEYDYEFNCLAPVLENIAVAEMAAPDGDIKIALQAAQQSFDIRSKSKKVADPNIVRTLAYALFLANKKEQAKAAAQDFSTRWSNMTGKSFNIDSGLVVQGKAVAFRSLLQIEK